MRSICISIVAMLVLAGTSLAATINVPVDYNTIQEAIDAASDGDEILVAPGTYTSTQDGHVVDMKGKAITLRASGTPEETIIDGQGVRRGIACFNSETESTVIEGFTITNGLGVDYNYDDDDDTDWWEDDGGGILCYNSCPTITGCTISGNTDDDNGGGIYCYWSCPTITGCTISGNTANYGGGIYCDNSTPTISDCTISGNTADYYGGGIYCDNYSPRILGSQICGNHPEQINGNWESDGGNNIATSCPVAPPSGACCVSSGCHALTEDACAGMGGTWLGEDASCDDCAPTCQGDANADGTVDIFDLLKVIDGWGTCP